VELTAAGYILLPLSALFLFRTGVLLQILLVVSALGATSTIILNVGEPFGMTCALVPGAIATGMLVLDCMSRSLQKNEWDAARSAAPLVLFTLCCIAGAALLPRLFAGEFEVWPQNIAIANVPVPLEPNSGNITQTLYLVTNVITMAFAALFASRPGTRYAIFLRAYFISGYIACALALWQLANKLTGVYFPEEFIYSNPRWAILTNQAFGNVNRINGSFTEPAALATYLSGVVFACVPLVFAGYRDFPVRPLLLLALAVMLISTSTTGIVMAGIAIPLLLLRARQQEMRALALGLIASGAAALFFGMTVYLSAPTLVHHVEQLVSQVVESSVVDKSESESAVDRTTKDVDSVALLLPSAGLGAGWGSVRSSSLLPGVLGGSGLPGLALLIWFGLRTRRLVGRARAVAPDGPDRNALDAFAWSVAGTVIAALISAPTIDEMDFYVRLALLIGCAVRMRCDAAERLAPPQPIAAPALADAAPRLG
jgi:hypothetical protein